ncbi:3-deoxy-7-phosphoheptulonate synthase [Nocardia sp. NPDC050710]|uniref:3-deoxy-7-phosphoheptulonate synthase n=1 Tax=Nocardia sp. NPDC050710 TaxID=3157220 RepID=UPI0034095DA8
MKTTARSVSAPPGDSSAGGADRFDHPRTRMLLASEGLTMPILEQILGTELEVRVLRQDDVAAEQLPATVTDVLRVSGADRVIVRRSCLINSDMVTASVNYVVTVGGLAAASGVDDVHVPIGSSLISRGVSQRRHILRAGVARWTDGRLCAAKAYVIVLGDRPLCYIRESFNPNVIPPDHSAPADDRGWADEPESPTYLSPAPPRTNATSHDEPTWPNVELLPNGVVCPRNRLAPIHSAAREALTAELAEAVRGEAFVLHFGGGDTVPTFDTRAFAARRALIRAAATVLTHGLGMPIVTVDRLAGQFTAPRSAPVESTTVPVPYYSSRVTGADSGAPGGDRLPEAYFRAAATFDDRRGGQLPVTLCVDILRRAADRCLEPVLPDMLREVAALLPLAADAPPASHELYGSIPRLHLSREAPGESASSRRGPDRRWWDSATHLLWIGDRTRNPAHGLIEFAAGVRNPVAVALGPTATPQDVEFLCQQLNPENRPGRLTFVPRLGAARMVDDLPVLFDAARDTPVSWVCDPMYVETRTHEGRAIRRVDEVMARIRAFFRTCRETGTVIGGLHLDCAPEAVTEFLGREGRIDEHSADHRTRCDPGLDPAQTLSCAFTALTEMRAA